ncbi:hypothetical protein ACLOJK_033285 [Asimina triloba]
MDHVSPGDIIIAFHSSGPPPWSTSQNQHESNSEWDCVAVDISSVIAFWLFGFLETWGGFFGPSEHDFFLTVSSIIHLSWSVAAPKPHVMSHRLVVEHGKDLNELRIQAEQYPEAHKSDGVLQSESHGDTEKPNIKQVLVSSYNSLLAPKVKKACMDADNVAKERLQNGSPRACDENRVSNSWFTQFTTLLRRSLKERRHEAFNSLKVLQVVAAAVLAGSMWWHSDMRNVHDRLGLLFFISIFWGVFPSFNAVFTFPQERAIFMKERASGMYTLSSYFVAHLAGDLPMELILPSAFIGVCYWMAGLRPDAGAFLLTWIVLLWYVLVAQGLGLALGAAIMDAKQASTVVTVTMLAFLLTGGFYVHKVQYGVGEVMALLGCSHEQPSRVGCGLIDEEVTRISGPQTTQIVMTKKNHRLDSAVGYLSQTLSRHESILKASINA